jgi:hypothetical protein
LYSKKSTLGIITNTEIILNWKTESQKSLSLTLIYFRTFGKHWFIYTILNSAPNNTYFSYFTYYDDIQICVGFQPPIFSFTFTTFCIFSITNFYENLTWLPWYILLNPDWFAVSVSPFIPCILAEDTAYTFTIAIYSDFIDLWVLMIAIQLNQIFHVLQISHICIYMLLYVCVYLSLVIFVKQSAKVNKFTYGLINLLLNPFYFLHFLFQIK